MGQLAKQLMCEVEMNAGEHASSLPIPHWMKEDSDEKSALWQLNQELAEMEQLRGVKAQQFFSKVLSDKLILRRPNGKVIGKSDFLPTLFEPSPFIDYELECLEEIPVQVTGRQALVTLLLRTQDRYATVRCFRHIRLFTRTRKGWKLEFWYIYENLWG